MLAFRQEVLSIDLMVCSVKDFESLRMKENAYIKPNM